MMERKKYAGKRSAKPAERAAQAAFTACAIVSVSAVAAIAFYIIVNGVPALWRAGVGEVLFGTVWKPTSQEPKFGILYMILTSLAGTFLAALVSGPVGILTAVFLAEISGRRASAAVRSAVELLAGIPSVIYGLLGVWIINPLVYKLELKLFSNSPGHQFTGGANLLSAALVLAVMILPTVISVSEAAIRRVSQDIREASLALGASPMQTVFRLVLPAARPGITAAMTLGIGRALGEATAILLVAGNSVNLPLPFRSVRFLTNTIVSEMGYSRGEHREMLFAIGLVLFGFIMLINLFLNRCIKGSVKQPMKNRTKKTGSNEP